MVLEGFVLEDIRTDCCRSARETSDSSIDVRGCRHAEVPAFEVSGSEEVPDVELGRSFEGDERPHGADSIVLEWGQKIGQESLGPEDVVIGEHDH